MELVEYMRARGKERGLMVKDIAAGCGFGLLAYYRKLHGDSDFTLTEANKLCAMLDLDLNEFNQMYQEAKNAK